jgi:hypothetical protein
VRTTVAYIEGAIKVIGVIAALGIVVQEGDNLADLGLNDWLNSEVSGLDFVLLLVTVVAVVILGFVALFDWLGRGRSDVT